MPRIRYDPVGRCIYCDSTSNLTEEHSFPAAIDGHFVLPEATCGDCQKITTAFESKLFQTDRLVRSALGFNRSRRRTAPRTAPLTATIDGEEVQVRVPIEKHPLPMVFPVFPPPGSLAGGPPKKGLEVTKLQVISFGTPTADISPHAKATRVTARAKTDHVSLARMVAKLALTQAVAHYGLDAFREIFIRGVILGTDEYVGHVVGCYTESEQPLPKGGAGHQAQVSWVEAADSNGVAVRVVQAHIHLYSGSPSPGYHVIVGFLRPDFEPKRSKYYIDSVILPRPRPPEAV
jgi:hypothetical protein